jgi:hypothetical protein
MVRSSVWTTSWLGWLAFATFVPAAAIPVDDGA